MPNVNLICREEGAAFSAVMSVADDSLQFIPTQAKASEYQVQTEMTLYRLPSRLGGTLAGSADFACHQLLAKMPAALHLPKGSNTERPNCARPSASNDLKTWLGGGPKTQTSNHRSRCMKCSP